MPYKCPNCKYVLSETHCLYRFFDCHGQLLYIGITGDPPARFKGHGREKVWWHQVSDIRLENYSSRKSLLQAEIDAIKQEKPLYNIAYNNTTIRSLT